MVPTRWMVPTMQNKFYTAIRELIMIINKELEVKR